MHMPGAEGGRFVHQGALYGRVMSTHTSLCAEAAEADGASGSVAGGQRTPDPVTASDAAGRT